MAIKSPRAVHGVPVVVPQVNEAMLSEKPVILSRLYLRIFQALAARNPFLRPQLDRIKRRLLALNRLEFRALVGGFWKDEAHHTLEERMRQREAWLADPTGLIESLDGRLTWIESATPEQIASEAACAPKILLGYEDVMDLAARKLPAIGWDVHELEREGLSAAFAVMACRNPAHAEHFERIKVRVLAMAPARRMAMRAAVWNDIKTMKLEDVAAMLEAIATTPAAKLAKIEARLDAAEALTAPEIEALLAGLPAVIKTVTELMQGAQPAEATVTG